MATNAAILNKLRPTHQPQARDVSSIVVGSAGAPGKVSLARAEYSKGQPLPWPIIAQGIALSLSHVFHFLALFFHLTIIVLSERRNKESQRTTLITTEYGPTMLTIMHLIMSLPGRT